MSVGPDPENLSAAIAEARTALLVLSVGTPHVELSQAAVHHLLRAAIAQESLSGGIRQCEWVTSDGLACTVLSAITWPSIVADTLRTGRYCREHAVVMAERALAGVKALPRVSR